MFHEYRPRIRVNRKKPVTRKGRYILTVCETEEDAVAVSEFLIAMFAAAKRDRDQAKAKMEQMRIDAQYAALTGNSEHAVALAAEDGVESVGLRSDNVELHSAEEPQEDE